MKTSMPHSKLSIANRLPAALRAALAIGLLFRLAGLPVADAADVTMTANDGLGTSSFNSAGTWSNAQAPGTGNDYFTAGRLMRTPSVAGDKIFAGDSLRVNGLAVTFDPLGDLNNAFMFKGPGYAATVGNMILDGAFIRHGEGDATTFTLDGNLNVAENGGGFHAQGTLNIASIISGSGSLVIRASGSGDIRRVVVFSGANTYDGNINLVNATQSRFRLADTGAMNFTIGGNGVNNSISGSGVAEYNGTFRFDLSGASTTVGDSWAIASVSSQTFGETFNVEGFSKNEDVWTSGNYEFSQANGVLAVVPEPSTYALMGLSSLLAFFWMRRRNDA